ncbi:Bifunctional purine biosynthetic protein ADE5,7 [Tilletia horrida]|nr:Bifunctional purine biosynthetic protein ADE5,7 [Tilletia horrida]
MAASPSLEDEIAQSRLERSNRRSRLLEHGVKGISARLGPDDDVQPSSPAAAASPAMASPTRSSSNSSSSNQQLPSTSAANVLSRYGGQAGPTGATFAPAAGASPVSLANFIGGRAAGPRLGKLQGDGRSAPPEAETFFRDTEALNSATSPTRRGIALPGLASPPAASEQAASSNKPLAAFLAARANALGNSSSPSAAAPSSSSPRVSPTKEIPPSAFARSLANATAAAQAAATDSPGPGPTPSPGPGPIAQQTTGGGTPISAATVSIIRRPSQTRGSPASAVSAAVLEPTPASAPATSPPKRSWTAQPALASDAFAADKFSTAVPTSSVPAPAPAPALAASPPKRSWSSQPAAATDASSSDKFPTASLTRLSAKGMVGQRIREAQKRQQSGSSDSDPARADSATTAAPGLAALRQRWANTAATAPAASSPEESGRRSPVRLPGLGGPNPPSNLLNSNDSAFGAPSARSPTVSGASAGSGSVSSSAAAPGGDSVQVLKPLTASRPRGPASSRKSKSGASASIVASPTTSAAPATPETASSAAHHQEAEQSSIKDEEVVIPSFRAPPPAQIQAEEPAQEDASPLARNPLPRPPSPDKEMYRATPTPATPAPAPSEPVTAAPPAATAAAIKPSAAPKQAEPAKGRRSTVGKRILVLISGSGSNFQALIDSTIPSLRTSGQPQIPYAQIVGVISNRKAAFGLERAKAADPPIPSEVFSLKSFRDAHTGKGRDEYDEALASLVLGYAPDIVVLAGFMHIVSPRFLKVLGHEASSPPSSSFVGAGAGTAAASASAPVPIINLHPALPGQFDGAGAIERAFEAFQAGTISHTGVMVHEVIAEVDRGAPVLVESIDMKALGIRSLEELQESIHQVEHRLIVEGTRKVLDRPHVVSPSLPSSPAVGSFAAAAALGGAPGGAGVHSPPTPHGNEWSSAGSGSASAAGSGGGGGGSSFSPTAWDQARSSHSRRVSLQSANKRQSLLFNSGVSGGSGTSSPSGGNTPKLAYAHTHTNSLAGAAAGSAAAAAAAAPVAVPKVDIAAVVASIASFRSSQAQAARTGPAAAAGFTISTEVLAVAPDGSTSVLPQANAEARTLFSSEVLTVVHRTKSSGSDPAAAGTRTRIIVRVGAGVASRSGGAASWKEGRQGDKVAELARRYNVPAEEVVEVVQGSETPELGFLLAGGNAAGAIAASAGATSAPDLIFRDGARPSSGAAGVAGAGGDASAMFAVRRVGSVVMIDQVPLSAVASLLNNIFVWHGRGSSPIQRHSAERFATTLAGGDASRVRRSEEGSEDDHFAMFFDLREGYASAWHHRHAPTLNDEQAIPVLVQLKPSSATAEAPTIASATAALEQEEHGGRISVVDLGLEIYVIVAAGARGRKAHIAAALDLADALAAKHVQHAHVPASRRSPVHVVILPGSLPRDLRAALRGATATAAATASSAGAGGAPQAGLGPRGGQLNVLESAEARAQLKKSVREFAAVELADPSCLPLGVAPEDL